MEQKSTLAMVDRIIRSKGGLPLKVRESEQLSIKISEGKINRSKEIKVEGKLSRHLSGQLSQAKNEIALIKDIAVTIDVALEIDIGCPFIPIKTANSIISTEISEISALPN